MAEFFSMEQAERDVIINNALEAGPTIPFPNFAKLFKTWLEILATFSEEQRAALFAGYVRHVAQNPQKLIGFNLDGILGIYNELSGEEKAVLSGTIGDIIGKLDSEHKRRIFLVIPAAARALFDP